MKLSRFLVFIAAIAFSCKLFAQVDGTLDATFGSGGKVTTDFGHFEQGNALTIQPDGKIIVAGGIQGYTWDTIYDFALARYNANGSLDSTFGLNGKTMTTFSEHTQGANAVALQSDGKIIAAGGAYLQFLLARYNSDGTLDTSFGSDGRVESNGCDLESTFTSLSIQPDGKILAAGYCGSNIHNGYYSIALARYNTNGTLDSTFNSGHLLSMNINQSYDAQDGASAIALQLDGEIVLAGWSGAGLYTSVAVLRFNSDGGLDSTFNSSGIVVTDLGISSGGLSVAIQSDDKIVVTGSVSSNTYLDFGVLRYNPDGSLDNSFGSGGVVTTSIGGNSSYATSIALVPNGRIVVAGDAYGYFTIARYKEDGTLDHSFSYGGLVTTDFSPYSTGATAIAMQADGRLVVTGGSNHNFAVARYTSGLNVGIINLSSLTNSVLIYPNPIEQTSTLEYALKNPETISIHLLDIQGKILKTFTENEKQEAGEHQKEISFPEQLSSGFYFLTISSANGNSVSVKVVK